MASINFFSQSIPFKVPNPRKTSSWLKNVVKREEHVLVELNYIFCSDRELYDINLKFLKHKTYTDIVTFDNSEVESEVEGDIYISVDRVKENAEKFGVSFETELRRVMVHGALHLLGYKDKTSGEKLAMRGKEDSYLSLFH